MRQFNTKGAPGVNGHMMYRISDEVYAETDTWLDKNGLSGEIDAAIKALPSQSATDTNAALDNISTRLLELWQMEAAMKTYGEAVADVMKFQQDEGSELPMTIEEWEAYAEKASISEAQDKARSMGCNAIWNCDIARTPEGYYQVRGGIPYAVAKSLGVAPFADIIWMETKTADLHDAKIFAEAIHAVYPDKMLAYNLSPSFNWDTTGMSEEEMRQFLLKLGNWASSSTSSPMVAIRLMAWPVKNLPKHSKRMACWLWLACNGSCASSTLLTGHLKPMSVGHDPMLASWQQPVAQRQPKQWQRLNPIPAPG